MLVADGGTRRNAPAGHMNNFVSRDGIAPADFRREARAQLTKYPNVSFRDGQIDTITGLRGDFQAGFENLAALWGHSVFQCPYCHGWETRKGRWGYYAPDSTIPHVGPFVMQLRGWSTEVTLFTDKLAGPRQLIAIRVDPAVLDGFRREARRRRVGYQTLINEVLARHVRRDVA